MPNLDPLKLTEKKSLHSGAGLPETYGFTEADLDRPIFIDYVLGSGNSHRCDEIS